MNIGVATMTFIKIRKIINRKLIKAILIIILLVKEGKPLANQLMEEVKDL